MAPVTTISSLAAVSGSAALTGAVSFPLDDANGATKRATLTALRALHAVYDVRDFGADVTGAASSVAAFQAAIDAATAAGGGIVDAPTGAYLMDGNENPRALGSYFGGVRLKSNVTLRVSSQATLTIKPTAQNGYSMFWVADCQNVTLDFADALLQGDALTHLGTAGEFGYLVTIADNAVNVTVRGGRFTNAWGDGIFVGPLVNNVTSPAARAARPQNVTLRDVLCDGNRRDGLTVAGVVGLTIGGRSRFVNSRGTPAGSGIGIDFEPDDRNIANEHVAVHGAVCEGNAGQSISIARTQSLTWHGGYLGLDADGTTVDTGISRNALNVEEAQSGDHLTFVGVTIAGPVRDPDYCHFVDCNVTLDLTTNAGTYAINHQKDAPSLWQGCRVRTKRYGRLMNSVGSTTRATAKRYTDCTFIVEGNSLPDTTAHSLVQAYHVVHRTAWRHEGASPATGYALSVNAPNIVWDRVDVDAAVALSFTSGRVSLDYARGVHEFDGVGPTTMATHGDTGVTITPGTDHKRQHWTAPLAAPRTVTVSAGAVNGDTLRVTRNASATGASALTVSANGGALTKALAAGEWTELIWDGTGTVWRLSASGSGV